MDYKTSDIYFASYLLCNNVDWKGHEKTDGKTVFIFEDDGSIDSLKREYVRDDVINICIYEYINNLRKLKIAFR